MVRGKWSGLIGMGYAAVCRQRQPSELNAGF